MRLKPFMAATAAFLSLSLIAACGADDSAAASGDGPIKVGAMLALSGPVAPFGIPERDVIESLVEEQNKQGGVNGRKVELITIDTAADPAKCARAVPDLVSQDVVAILGPTSGSCALATGPVAAREQLPFLFLGATIEVTDTDNGYYDWAFRTAPNDTTTTETLVKRVAESGAKRISVVYAEDPYGQFSLSLIKKLAPEHGLEIISEVGAKTDAADLSPHAVSARNSKPDAVLLQMNAATQGVAFVRAAKQVGLDSDLIWGAGALGTKPFAEAKGGVTEGVKVLVVANPYDPAPQTQKLMDIAGKKEISGFPELVASTAFVAFKEAVEAVDGDLTPESMRAALEGVCTEETYTEGGVCFKDGHDGVGYDSLRLTRVENGEFVNLD